MGDKKDSIIPSWNFLAKIGNSKIAKSSYFWIFFVPLSAKLIAKLKEWLPDESSLDLPYTWKIFFFSSLLFGLATLLYSWKCPDLVKKYTTWEKYKKVGLTKSQLLVFFSNWLRNGGEIRTAENNIVPHKEAVATVYDKFSDKSRPDLLLKNPVYAAKYIPITNNLENEAFWYIKGLMYGDKVNWRKGISIIYLIGFLLIASLILMNIYYVSKVSF